VQLDDRSNLLLQEILKTPEMTTKILEIRFNLSRKQVNYSLSKINHWLELNQLPKLKKNAKGVFVVAPSLINVLNGDDKNHIKHYVFSEEERVCSILILLLSRTEELSLFHFTAILKISKNTVLNDLKKVQHELKSYQLYISYSRLNGYWIGGEEFYKRKLLIAMINRMLDMYNGSYWIQTLTHISDSQLNKFYKKVERLEQMLSLKFTDERLTSMPFVLNLIVRRIGRGKTINDFHGDEQELLTTREYPIVKKMLYGVNEMPLAESLFMTLYILSTNIAFSEVLTETISIKLHRAIAQMLVLFENMACLILQDKEQLSHKILLHLKPAYYRIKYGLFTNLNPLQELVINEFNDLHHLVKKSMKPLVAVMGFEVPVNEIVYLTILIGGWLTRQRASIEAKIKVVVVCPDGVSVSKLMESVLKDIFPEFIFLEIFSVREFQNSHLSYDLVFSSVYVETRKRLFVIKPFLNRDDKIRLRKQVMQSLYGYTPSQLNVNKIIEIIEKQTPIENKALLERDLKDYFTTDSKALIWDRQAEKPDLNQLITPETIVLHERVSTWKEAIYFSSQPLLKNKSITLNYVKAMITQYNEDEPYIVIAPNLAIPHAKPEAGVNQVAMSLLRLEKGVLFSEECLVNIVIVIAAEDKQKHLPALLQLTQLAECREWINSIIKANSIKAIHDLVSCYPKIAKK